MPRTVQGRAIIGVIALYALLLQTFLGGLAPLPLTHIGNEICAQDNGFGVPREQEPACLHKACCTAVHANELLQPLLTAFVTVVWVPTRVITAQWREPGSAQARAPPGPRGPPAV